MIEQEKDPETRGSWSLPALVRLLSPLEALGNRQAVCEGLAESLLMTVAVGCQIRTIEAAAGRPLVERWVGDGPAPWLSPEAITAAVRRGNPTLVEKAGVTWVVTSVAHGPRRLGTLCAAIHPAFLPLSDDDLRSLGRVGRGLGTALAAADARERAAQISHTLQRSLLPSALPTPDWLEMAGGYEPGTADLEIGGDWYDAQVMADGTIALSVGDVAGHGVEAAAQMGELRSATTALRLVRRSPDQLISVLHQVTANMGSLATAICVRLDPFGNLYWASAGHLPPLIVRADGPAEILDTAQSPPLGCQYDDPVPVNRSHLNAGDTLVLYTDGLVERRDEPLDISIKGLAERLETLGHMDPAALVRVLAARHEDAQSTGDDIAVIVAKRIR